MRHRISPLVRRATIALLAAFSVAGTYVGVAQSLPTIRVVGPGNDGYKAVYYGVQSGIFRKDGVDVKTQIVSSGAAAAAAIAGGSADVAYTNVLSLIQAHRRGVPLQIVSPGVILLSERPFTATVVLKDSPIRSGRDLDGKTIGSTSLQDINAAATLAWIDKTGGDSHSVHFIEVPGSVAVAALEEHRADAVTLNEPLVSQALATGKVRVLCHPYEAIAKRLQTAVFVAAAPVIEKNRDAMARFARGMHEAQDYTNSHPAQTVDLVASYSGISPADVAKSVRAVDASYADPKELQPVIDILAKYKMIDKSFPADELISSVALRPR
jgi:NitT/TauT family transport system substrate-binding protein